MLVVTCLFAGILAFAIGLMHVLIETIKEKRK